MNYMRVMGVVCFLAASGVWAADIQAVLDSADGSSAMVVVDSQTNAKVRIGSDGAILVSNLVNRGASARHMLSIAGPQDIEVGTGANGYNNGVAIGELANGTSDGVAVGTLANGLTEAVALGSHANANDAGAAVGFFADGHNSGAALGAQAIGDVRGAAVGSYANSHDSGAALGYEANGADGGVAVGYQANGDLYGAALGFRAEAPNGSIALGPYAHGAGSNIAVGYQANVPGGIYRIALGRNVTNTINNSARIRGTLYLDGGTNVYVRSGFGGGAWTPLVPDETDPIWSAASNRYMTTNASASFVNKAGDSMTGPLAVGTLTNVNEIVFSGGTISIGRTANGDNEGTAIGADSDGSFLGVAVGQQANGHSFGIGIGQYAAGHNSGVAMGNETFGHDQGVAIGYQAMGYSNGVGLGNGVWGQNAGAAVGSGAMGYESGAAVGLATRAIHAGAALGMRANGSKTNIAIGVSANAQGGSERIAIGHNVTNDANHTTRIRGTLYLDGATGILARAAFGTGAWSNLIPEMANYVSKSGDTMTGPLAVGTLTNVNELVFNGGTISIGRVANGDNEGTAIGADSDGSFMGVAVGQQANGHSFGIGIGQYAAGHNSGVAMGNETFGHDQGVAIGYQAMGYSNGVGLGNGAWGYNIGVAVGSGAIGYEAGSAVGLATRAIHAGVALGMRANGSKTNVAIGLAANAQAGSERIAIGHNVTNQLDDSARIRGTLYLDGGTGVLYRATFGSGGWTAKAFTIPHPLDPENKVLRHYCMEGPEVWNVYAGNAQILNGEAIIALPDYYTALNKAGSEIYSLTPIGQDATPWIKAKVRDGQFIVGCRADIEVSWTIKVLRNDPACLEDLRQRPVEQLKSELPVGQEAAENRVVDTP